MSGPSEPTAPRRLMVLSYPSASIPAWCGMWPLDHHDGMGGCWGISHGLVAEKGRAYCDGCDYLKATA